MPTIPIPKRPSGFTLGASDADVAIEVFLDIQCPHSKMAWPTLLEILDHYQSAPVSVTVHVITLSNHRQAWDVSLGLFALAGRDARAFFDFTSFIYERQSLFYNNEFLHKTHHDLRDLVADFAAEHAKVDRQAFLLRLDDAGVYTDARTPIRYAATRSVWATPTLFVNNADDLTVDHTSSLEDWQTLIEPLLAH